jgi:hypothetical protein
VAHVLGAGQYALGQDYAPLKHQIKIAIRTLKLSDTGALIMGGPTKAQARETLLSAGYVDEAIRRIEDANSRR